METWDRLSTYPRQRPPLTAEHERIFEEEYRLNRTGGAPMEKLSKVLESWMHRKVASQRGGPLLELGAGTLNHVRFEGDSHAYDVVEPFRALYEDRSERSRVRHFYDSVRDVPQDESYVRVISIATLEHMVDLPVDLTEAALRLRPDGVFQAGIPSEGGALWGLGWRASTGISYRLRTGLDYGVIIRHEHVNTAEEITSLIRHLFREVEIHRFPLPWRHTSLYTYLEAQAPILSRCGKILKESGRGTIQFDA